MQVFQLLAFENLTPLNWEVVLQALTILWQGLLAIFVVIGLIVLAVKITNYVINTLTARAAARREEEREDDERK